MSQSESFQGWEIVEVMGRQTFAGRLSEQTLGGVPFVRVDVPQVGERAEFTKMFGASAIYAITIVSEEVAREAAQRFYTPPPIEFRRPAPAIAAPRVFEEQDHDFDDDDVPY